jgi:hypothetical protein
MRVSGLIPANMEGMRLSRRSTIGSRSRSSGTWTRSDILAAASLLLSVVALAVTAVLGVRSNAIANRATDQSRQANDIAASAQTLRPKLTATSARTGLVTDLKGISTENEPLPPNAVVDGTAEQETGMRGPQIEVLLANAGQRASVVDVAEVEVSFAQKITECATGGGGGIVTKNYDIPLPALPHPIPFTVPKSIAYQVEGGGSGSITLTIGQAWISDTDAPLVIRATVTLLHDSGERLDVGTFALVDPGIGGYATLSEKGWQFAGSNDQTPQDCLRSGATMARQIVSEPGIIVSDELKSLVTAMKDY